MDPTVAALGSVRIKFRDKISDLPLENLCYFDEFLYKITQLKLLNDHEITICTPDGESLSFIFDLNSFQSIRKDNCVVLSQYSVEFFEIYPTINDGFYVVDIKKSGKLYRQDYY
jgi:hypothetical protein